MMNKSRKLFIVLDLFLFPFVITLVERLVLKPIITVFPLPATSVTLFKLVAISLLLLGFAAFLGKKYGLEITKKLGKVLGVMFVVLLLICYFFLSSLKLKGFFDDLAVIHLVNWMLTVFREEYILRGIVQTEASGVLIGKFLHISYPIWLSTIVFSVWHLVNLSVWPWQVVLVQLISCIPSGLILGTIREKTGNTLLTYLLHISGDLLFFSLYTLVFGKLFFSLL